MQINDETGNFTQEELQTLQTFINDELLSTEVELEWLGKIIIRNNGRSGYGGYWDIKVYFSTEDPNQIESVIAIIVLNFYVVKILPHSQRLERLMEILAHEYGHHWTLSYLIINQTIQDYFEDRLPEDYYTIRGLNPIEYAPDYSQQWHKCDKEVIAEDYRYLFAPSPYNNDHQMTQELPLPCDQVKSYIQNINQLL